MVTLEDPIEYLHRHGKSIISQREISIDTESYAVLCGPLCARRPMSFCWEK